MGSGQARLPGPRRQERGVRRHQGEQVRGRHEADHPRWRPAGFQARRHRDEVHRPEGPGGRRCGRGRQRLQGHPCPDQGGVEEGPGVEVVVHRRLNVEAAPSAQQGMHSGTQDLSAGPTTRGW
eukprot:532434-Pyramimonas_sp.AAC.1